MPAEQRIRAFLFYLSVFVFLIGLPFILSFALGYKFDRRTFKFTKTGLIFLKTQPPGASIYLDGKLLNEKTPTTLRELLPGTYRIRLELEKHYSWIQEVKVEPRKVMLLDKIILFPLRPNIKHINKQGFDSYLIDEPEGAIYYINYEHGNIYRSDLEGIRYEKVADFHVISPYPLKWKFSPDKKKLLYFNRYQIGITYLESPRDKLVLVAPFILDYPAGSIIDVFWHSDNYHLVIMSDKDIEVLEAKPESRPIELVKLNKKDSLAFYNIHEDTLYFIDSQTADDGNIYDNLYKLELNARTFPFLELIKLKTNEPR